MLSLLIISQFQILFIQIQKMDKINRVSIDMIFQSGSERQQIKKQPQLTPQNASVLKPIQLLLKQYIIQSGIIPSKRHSFTLCPQQISAKSIQKSITLSKSQQQIQKQHKLALNQMEAIAITRMGIRNYDNMQNQDVILQSHIINKCKIYGIFDGHGQHGRIIALTIKNVFITFLNKYIEDIKNESSIFSIQSIVKKVLQKTNSYLLHYKAEEVQFSGATALVVLITTFNIYTFNIGNSRVVLGKYYEQQNKIASFQLTHDHTLNRFDQKTRILQNGGLIEPYKNQRGQYIGPDRIWALGGNYPGIFVTRTLGLSCSYKLGVSPEPEIGVLKYKQCFKYIIMGSDGLWAVFENQQIVKMLEKSTIMTLNGYVNSIIFQALKRWRDRHELMDDLSLIVIPLING